MGTVKNAVYQVDNGVDFDEIHFKTKGSQVFMADGTTAEALKTKVNNGQNFKLTQDDGYSFMDISNANNILANIEVYITGGLSNNLPSDAFNGYISMTSHGSGWGVQVARDVFNTKKTYTRELTGNSWQAWRSL